MIPTTNKQGEPVVLTLEQYMDTLTPEEQEDAWEYLNSLPPSDDFINNEISLNAYLDVNEDDINPLNRYK